MCGIEATGLWQISHRPVIPKLRGEKKLTVRRM